MALPIRLKDILLGPAGSDPDPSSGIVLGNQLFFTAKDLTHGEELWVTDGTPAGTRLVRDIRAGSGGSSPWLNGAVALGNQLFFEAFDDANGSELWRSDGTTSGTRLVKDIAPGRGPSGLYAIGSRPNYLTTVGNRLFFKADDGTTGQELWTSDGTTTSTRQVRDLRQGVSYEARSSQPDTLTAFGTQLLFWADDGLKGRELWGTDNSGVTRLIKDTNNGPTSGHPGSDSFMYVMNTVAGERLFFNANNGSNGEELWVSDGTTTGTKLLKDITPGPDSSDLTSYLGGRYITNLTTIGKQLFFMVDEQQLWTSDGKPEGTGLLGGFPGFSFGIRGVVDKKIFIDDIDYFGDEELWVVDSTANNAKRLRTFNEGPNPSTLEAEKTTIGKNFFFTAHTSSNGNELWVSDGTATGTRLVKDIRPGSAASNPRGFVTARGLLYFWADDGVHGIELWRSDGTAAGTNLVADLKPGRGGSIVDRGSGFFDYSSKVVSNKLVFQADDGKNGAELWALTLPDPNSPTLAISTLSASKTEGRSGSTPFTFQVIRSGNNSGLASVRWTVSAAGTKAAIASDFGGSGFQSGTVAFAAGQTRQTITVNVAGDLGKEGDETFRVSLSGSTGAAITTATANGTILNDDLIGDTNRNRLVGTARAEFIDGRANLDTLTGGSAADVFAFRFGESRLSAPDAITDFAFDTDKIELFTPTGGARPTPARFSRAADNSSASRLSALSAAVFADANGALAGNQALGANDAALVRSTNAAIAGTYLLINNSVAGRSDSDDLMIKLNGFSGALPGLGVLGVSRVFA